MEPRVGYVKFHRLLTLMLLSCAYILERVLPSGKRENKILVVEIDFDLGLTLHSYDFNLDD